MIKKIRINLLLLSLALLSCKGIEKQYPIIEKEENIMDATNTEKIHSKKINNTFELELNRKADKTYCAWKINLVGKKEKRTIKTDSLTKDEIEKTHFRLMYHPMFYDAFQILDAIHDKSTNQLLVLIDRLGEIILYQYTFDGKTLDSISPQDKIQVTTYSIRTQDVMLILASHAKLYSSDNEVCAVVSINSEDKFFSINLKSKTAKSLIFDYYANERVKIKDTENHEFIFTGNIENKKKTTNIIEGLLKKSDHTDQPWVYHFFIESTDAAYFFREGGNRNDLVYFFTTINGNKKVLIYDTSAAKEWVITDYQELSEGESKEDTWK